MRRAFALLAVTIVASGNGMAASRTVRVMRDFEDSPTGTQVFLQYDGVTFVGGDTTYSDSTHPITIGQPPQGTISGTRAVVAAFHNPIIGCENPCTSEVTLAFD